MLCRLLLLITLTSAYLLPSTGRADWINLTGAETSPNIAEIYVMDDHVRVVLEVYVDNLEVFEDLVPDDWVSELDVERPDKSTPVCGISPRKSFRSLHPMASSCRHNWSWSSHASVSIASHPLPA